MSTFKAQDPNFEQRVRDSFSRQAFMEYVGAKLGRVEPGYCEIILDYDDQLTQQHGYIHGGLVSTLGDNAAGYAAFTLMASTSTVLTVEYKINLMSPALGESIIAKAQVLKNGRNIKVCRSDVFAVKDGEEKICAALQVTLMELHERSDSK